MPERFAKAAPMWAPLDVEWRNLKVGLSVLRPEELGPRHRYLPTERVVAGFMLACSECANRALALNAHYPCGFSPGMLMLLRIIVEDAV
jgi:hypothetical protein